MVEAPPGRGATNEERATLRRVEIVHESLLREWPRLVRWRAQDEEGALLRDQLRQAAQLWEERDRPEDLLWTGTSFREYELWRERYEGGLSEQESTFAAAMANIATRRRRRRRIAIATIVVLALGIATVTSSLWRRSETARRQAVSAEEQARAEALRAEAQKLLVLGQLELDVSPTVTLAYATRSLELTDSREARMLALQALAAGPPATVLKLGSADLEDRAHEVVFTPNGEWAVLVGYRALQVLSRDGRTRLSLDPFPAGRNWVAATFDPSGEHLYGAQGEELRVWSVPDFQLLDRQTLPGGKTWLLRATSTALFALTVQGREQVITAHSIGAQPRLVRRNEIPSSRWKDIDRSGRWLAFSLGNELFVRSLADWDRPPRRFGTHREPLEAVVFHPAGDRIAVEAVSGNLSIWGTQGERPEPTRDLLRSNLSGVISGLTFDGVGRHLAAFGEGSETLRVSLWDLEAPADAAPRALSASPTAGELAINGATFDPGGHWLATGHEDSVAFWPLASGRQRTLVGHRGRVFDLLFTPDGRRLLSRDITGEVREWGLNAGESSRTLARVAGGKTLAVDTLGRFVAVAQRGGARIVPLGGGPEERLEGFAAAAQVGSVTISPNGRLVAAAPYQGAADQNVIRLWDLEAGDTWTLGPIEEVEDGFEGGIWDLHFLPDGSLVSSSEVGIRLWDPREATHEVAATGDRKSFLEHFGHGRYVASLLESEELTITDLEMRTTRSLPAHGRLEFPNPVAVDPTGTIIVSARGEQVQVGPVSGEEPHLLVGHEGVVWTLAVSPDGRWIASAGDDLTVRLWPMPDLSKPPLHTLPREELLAKLRGLSNVRVVEDQDSSTGWKVEVGTFPGWEEVPTW